MTLDQIDKVKEALGSLYLFAVQMPNFTNADQQAYREAAKILRTAKDTESEMYELLLQAYDRFTDNDMVPPNEKLRSWINKTRTIFEKVNIERTTQG